MFFCEDAFLKPLSPENLLIYGIHPLRMVIAHRFKAVSKLFLEQKQSKKTLSKLFEGMKSNIIHEIERKISFVDEKYLFDVTKNVHHQGIAGIIVPKNFESLKILSCENNKKLRILVLDQIQDPRNTGAIIRTAVQLGFRHIIFPDSHSSGMTPTVYKTSSGAIELATLYQVTNIRQSLELMKEKGFWVAGAVIPEMNEKVISLQELPLDCPLAIVIGNEEKGLRKLTKEHCDFLVHIQTEYSNLSFNVSVAAALFMFHVYHHSK